MLGTLWTVTSLPPPHHSRARQRARASSFLRFLDHTQTHDIRQHSSGRVIGPSQRPLPYNSQLSQQTDRHATGGIRTRNPGKRAAADRAASVMGRYGDVSGQCAAKDGYIATAVGVGTSCNTVCSDRKSLALYFVSQNNGVK